MIHIFVLILVISLAIGVGVIFLFVQMNKRHPNLILRYYLGVLICLGGALFSDLLSVYITIVDIGSSTLITDLNIAAAIFYHIMMGGLFFTLPNFTAQLLGKPLSSRAKVILGTITFLYPTSIIAYYFLQSQMFIYVGDPLILLIIIYTIVRLFPRKIPGENPHHRNIANTMSIILMVFLPLFFIDMFFEVSIGNIDNLNIDVSLFLLLFYFAWNIVNASYLVKQFRLAIEPQGFEYSVQRMHELLLSKREQEIVELIAGGASNKEIGQKLVISTMTVKNHVYNIYKKTGASSRVELLNILSK
ncbi:MAG: helix-turn-helix transcriptional regulator [Anaerolineaceae bacterium]|nr:helix-turn-helix transcriptional regulator [Anaerolineaceae bacterium]